MDREAMRRAQQTSRDAYLRKRAAMREKAASVVLQEKITEIEAGVLPSSFTEIELLSKRAQEVKAAERLQVAANMRQEIITLDGGPALGEKRHRDVVVPPLIQEEMIVQEDTQRHAEASHGFVAMDKAIIDDRIEKHDYTEEVTEEEIKRERTAALQNQNRRLQEQRRSLPIYQSRGALLELIRNNPVVIIVGETGSGKTTQLLQYLYEENLHEPAPPTSANAEGVTSEPVGEVTQGKRLICTQPRRLAAISVAERVAQEMNTRCGSIVGYKVRFDDRTGPLTRVLFVTDGMMLKEVVGDPSLNTVAAIMVDEAHERSLNTDILLGLLKDIIRGNKQLRVIVASATINADKFSDFFNRAPIFTVKGRSFPVDTSYITEPVADYVKASVDCILMLHATKPLPGDILVFLPGQEEIESCAAAVREALVETAGQLRPLLVLPVYSSLPPREQKRIYEVPPPNTRKVVIATNIAETSITIDGIVYVVDCGLCKQNYYNHRAMIEELRVLPISQASATQRAGRAGRTREGDCYRLYTTYTFHNEFPSETVPEILRSSMSSVVLQLKALGINNLLQFEFIDAPSTASLERALDHLYLLGAMKQDGRLTLTGRRMAEFPLDPSLSKSVIRASAMGCLRHMAIAVAMLSLDSIFINTRDPKERIAMTSARDKMFSSGNGDVVGYVRLMEEWLRSGSLKQEFCDTNYVNSKSLLRARDILDQILKTCERLGFDLPNGQEADALSVEALTKALLSGFFMNVSVLGLDKRTYSIVRPIDPTVSRLGAASQVGSGNRFGDAESAVELHPSSYLFRTGTSTHGERSKGLPPTPSMVAMEERPRLVVFTQLRCTKKRYMMHVTAVPSADWVLAVAPVNYFTKEELEVETHKRKHV
ncbi:pre-mRNA splicing factor ATP-dependent RNA helicase, putative [Trypanosoma equiperdum]|uniref:RNA helicase n=2 Tax=Trypanozoon TaxID=39700 RepID=Q38B75_TRYB2|nr:pre-mRNA splicing factor ATP-dependent RNA helicase, putative [Trypanosoma brucei brucei TREU927]EAN77945.1 pre-mRNA splicing factor ATP-dependent RNA helicase, putative [Trypanosoma brucei brucei TREU927]SCU65436.1 pre-mRNA splicing factor ATP-dependent RNA helicase, putative [Trypanosoma equiperdum]